MEREATIIVIAPNGCEDYLTPNKEYEAFNINWHDGKISSFNVINDSEDEIFTCFKNSAHLNFQDWTIKDQDKP